MLTGVYNIFQKKWNPSGTVWIYSDPHFSDKELQNAIPNRPSDEELVKRINSKVGKNDTLIILGDIGNLNYVRQLKGRYKVLLLGNHDKGKSNYIQKTMTKIYDYHKYSKKEVLDNLYKKYPEWKINEIYYQETEFYSPFQRWVCSLTNNLFDEVYEGPLMIGEKIILSHEPIPNLTWAVNIHGHNHNKSEEVDKHYINVCADVINYEPINLNKLLLEYGLSSIDSLHRITIDKATERSNNEKY